MVMRGLISRQKDEHDRRSTVLNMTLKGREVFEGVENRAADKVLEKLTLMEDREVIEIEQALLKIEELIYPK